MLTKHSENDKVVIHHEGLEDWDIASLKRWRVACVPVGNAILAEPELVRADQKAFGPWQAWTSRDLVKGLMANAFYAIATAMNLGFAVTMADCMLLADAVYDNWLDLKG